MYIYLLKARWQGGLGEVGEYAYYFSSTEKAVNYGHELLATEPTDEKPERYISYDIQAIKLDSKKAYPTLF